MSRWTGRVEVDHKHGRVRGALLDAGSALHGAFNAIKLLVPRESRNRWNRRDQDRQGVYCLKGTRGPPILEGRTEGRTRRTEGIHQNKTFILSFIRNPKEYIGIRPHLPIERHTTTAHHYCTPLLHTTATMHRHYCVNGRGRRPQL